MARDVYEKHKMVLASRRLHAGRWHDEGDEVEMYGDDADRAEERGFAKGKSARRSRPASSDNDNDKG